jgi:hypothetical protein
MKSAAQTPRVRINPRAHTAIRQIAEEERESMQAVLDKAIERYRREGFLQSAKADFAALKTDPKAWREETRGERTMGTYAS